MGFEITLGIGYASLVLGNVGGTNHDEGVAGLFMLGMSVASLLYVNWPRDYTTTCVDLFEHTEYLEKGTGDLLLQLTSDAQNAFSQNNQKLKTKARFYKAAIVLLLVATFLFLMSKSPNFYV